MENYHPGNERQTMWKFHAGRVKFAWRKKYHLIRGSECFNLFFSFCVHGHSVNKFFIKIMFASNALKLLCLFLRTSIMYTLRWEIEILLFFEPWQPHRLLPKLLAGDIFNLMCTLCVLNKCNIFISLFNSLTIVTLCGIFCFFYTCNISYCNYFQLPVDVTKYQMFTVR